MHKSMHRNDPQNQAVLYGLHLIRKGLAVLASTSPENYEWLRLIRAAIKRIEKNTPA